MVNQDTKKHILEATINAIEKYGIQSLTTRNIANEAGVNNAALHYYYGTKEELIELALKQTLDHMLEDTVDILADQSSIEDRLRTLLDYIIDGILRYPNLIRAHLYEPLMKDNADSPLLNVFNIWVEEISKAINHGLDQEHKQSLKYQIFSLISSTLMAGLLPLREENFPPVNMNDPISRKEFVDHFIQCILSEIQL